MDRKRLEQELAEAEAEFDAATKLSDIKRVAGRLHRARAALRKPTLRPAVRSRVPNVRGLNRAGAAPRATEPGPQILECQLPTVALAQRGEVELTVVAARLAIGIELVAVAEITDRADCDCSLLPSVASHVRPCSLFVLRMLAGPLAGVNGEDPAGPATTPYRNGARQPASSAWRSEQNQRSP
jgi:hypothetical protein